MAPALPSGWSRIPVRSRDGLHQALLTAGGDRAFCDVPVDWWDGAARIWRPTAIVRVLGVVWDVHREAEILVPAPGTTTQRRVAIDELRLSRLLTAGIVRFWVSRYRRLLVLSLIEQVATSRRELDELRRLADSIHHEEALSRDVWATAFATGATDATEHPPEQWPGGALVPDQGYALYGNAVMGRSATRVLASDLLRIDMALDAAGATPEERAAHPLASAIAGLLMAAPEWAPSVSPAERGLRLA